jgi:hypothetical protein
MASKVEKRMALTLPVFQLVRLAKLTPTCSESSWSFTLCSVYMLRGFVINFIDKFTDGECVVEEGCMSYNKGNESCVGD